jgi:hypothetical protein
VRARRVPTNNQRAWTPSGGGNALAATLVPNVGRCPAPLPPRSARQSAAPNCRAWPWTWAARKATAVAGTLGLLPAVAVVAMASLPSRSSAVLFLIKQTV